MAVMMRRWGWLAGLAVLAAALSWWQTRPSQPVRPVALACADIVTGCAIPAAGLRVAFDRSPQPLQSFALRVQRAGAREVHASFSMHGMEMGFNRYRLLAQPDGSWQAQVMLPACVQGRSDWELLLEIDGARYTLPFSAGAPSP